MGAILRTADGAGVVRAYLCGLTPTPIDRFGRARADIAKAALGAEQAVLWEYVEDVRTLIARLKKDHVQVVAVEQDARSVPYTEHAVHGRVALVLGAEVEGLPKDVLDQCDAIIEIPMRGSKESLNVSVAAGIALYRLTSSE